MHKKFNFNTYILDNQAFENYISSIPHRSHSRTMTWKRIWNKSRITDHQNQLLKSTNLIDNFLNRPKTEFTLYLTSQNKGWLLFLLLSNQFMSACEGFPFHMCKRIVWHKKTIISMSRIDMSGFGMESLARVACVLK